MSNLRKLDNPFVNISNGTFINDIINGMYDWVRVLDCDRNIVYVNKAMSEALGDNIVGRKCFTGIGKDCICDDCISCEAISNNIPYEKEEIINDRIYSVMSSPVKDKDGTIIGVVEVLRDITGTKTMQQKVLDQNTKFRYELDIAKRLQLSLLPKDFSHSSIDFSFIYKPCDAMGGDFIDIFKIDKDHVGIYIADVSGHGVPASMFTVFLHSTLDKALLSPAQALTGLYQEFNRGKLDHDLYITVFYAIINLETNLIKYANAGHNASPVVFGRERFDILRSPGIPISNWLESPEYSDRTCQLTNKDRIFFYTDGIIELKNKSGEQYGEKRLLDILLNDAFKPDTTLDKIVKDAYRFAGIDEQSGIPDDITMALLEIK